MCWTLLCTQLTSLQTMEVKVGPAIGLGHNEESNGPPMNYDQFGAGYKSLKLRAKLI